MNLKELLNEVEKTNIILKNAIKKYDEQLGNKGYKTQQEADKGLIKSFHDLIEAGRLNEEACRKYIETKRKLDEPVDKVE
jgi:hypothetical protein